MASLGAEDSVSLEWRALADFQSFALQQVRQELLAAEARLKDSFAAYRQGARPVPALALQSKPQPAGVGLRQAAVVAESPDGPEQREAAEPIVLLPGVAKDESLKLQTQDSGRFEFAPVQALASPVSNFRPGTGAQQAWGPQSVSPGSTAASFRPKRVAKPAQAPSAGMPVSNSELTSTRIKPPAFGRACMASDEHTVVEPFDPSLADDERRDVVVKEGREEENEHEIWNDGFVKEDREEDPSLANPVKRALKSVALHASGWAVDSERVTELGPRRAGRSRASTLHSQSQSRRSTLSFGMHLHKGATTTLANPVTASADDEATVDYDDLDFNRLTYWQALLSVLEIIVCSKPFDYASTALILLNGVSIGYQTDYLARHVQEEVPGPLVVIESLFCAIFTVEIFFRLLVFRSRFFKMKQWRWNVFDLGLVCLQLAQALAEVAVEAFADSDSRPLTLLRFMRFLRLIRAIRIMRVLRLVQELRTIVLSIMGCVRPFFWTLSMFWLVLYVFGVYLTQLILDHRLSNEDEEFPVLDGYFGSLGHSMLVLFQAVAGGIDWRDMLTPLMEEIHPIAAVVLVFYIAFILLAMMNFVAAIFVESAIQGAKTDKEMSVSQNVWHAFEKLDINHSGTISLEEFEEQVDKQEMVDFFEAIDMDITEARGLFLILDGNDTGAINANEFVQGCLRLRGTAKSMDLLLLTRETRKIFQMYFQHLSNVESKLSELAGSMLRRPGLLDAVPSAGLH